MARSSRHDWVKARGVILWHVFNVEPALERRNMSPHHGHEGIQLGGPKCAWMMVCEEQN